MADAGRFNPDGLVLSGQYARTMEEIVLPRLDAARRVLTVAGEGGAPLYAERYAAAAPRGTVLVLHGFTENAFKYGEVIHSLLENGFSVVAYDQRGHGRSWRDPLIADRSLTHVERFDEYVADLEAVCAQVMEGMPRPWSILAHSMGGAVAALFLERHGDAFDRAVLCAPMIAPNLGGLSEGVTRLLCATQRVLGRGRRRVFASRPYSGPENFDTSCAAGRERFDWYDAVKAARPEFQNNGPTYGWTLEAIGVTERILSPGAVERIAASVRLYAAEQDYSVMPEPQEQFIRRVGDGARTLVPGSRHEIYRSGDDVLFPWWREALNFLDAQGAGTLAV